MTEGFKPYPKPAGQQTNPALAISPGPLPSNVLLRKMPHVSTQRMPQVSTQAETASPLGATDLDGAYSDFAAIVPGSEAKRTQPVTDMDEAMRFHRANAFTWQLCVYNNQ